MLKKAIMISIAVGFASPAIANDQLARAAGVDPGMYTLSELVQIMSYSGRQRASRIELIHQQRAAFDATVREAIESGRLGVLSTRSPGS